MTPPGPASDTGGESRRGCVFFNFGQACALRLLVSIHSLRRHYDGPVTVFLARDAAGRRLPAPLKQLGCDIVFDDGLSKSLDRHRLFLDSPYHTTLVLESDLLFLGPIDALWEPLEREGVLVTRMYAPLYGVDGSREQPRGRVTRIGLIHQVAGLVDADTHAAAVRRLTEERIDINLGVLGISRPAGAEFLADWGDAMERGRGSGIAFLDELLVLALTAKHRHFLAGEPWNCPADEFFRRTNLADAVIIHYFADGEIVRGLRLGRNPDTWAGKKWLEAYRDAAGDMDLKPWESRDRLFTRTARILLARKLLGNAGRLRKQLGRRLSRLAGIAGLR